jgi:hypothetical protein
VTRQADFKRRVRERMRKTGESCATARTQRLSTRPGPVVARLPVLHVTNGDSTAGTLERAGIGERVLPWRDALHEGPVPDVASDELRRLRADFLAGSEAARAADILDWLQARDETLAVARAGAYVLWFEADLYDQLQLAEILARLGELEVPASRVTLISIGEYPGIAHFGGLGELNEEQLEDLLATNAAAPLSDDAIELAGAAWSAFRAPDPSGLVAIARRQSPELRFLGEAFDRLAREYPSTRDGLSLTERRILAAASETVEPQTAGRVFVRVGSREARPFLGDRFCFETIERLAGRHTPLVEADVPVTPQTPIRLTDAGRAVLEGSADYVLLNGIDRWIGGVHLAGKTARWRWDEGIEAITTVT